MKNKKSQIVNTLYKYFSKVVNTCNPLFFISSHKHLDKFVGIHLLTRKVFFIWSLLHWLNKGEYFSKGRRIECLISKRLQWMSLITFKNINILRHCTQEENNKNRNIFSITSAVMIFRPRNCLSILMNSSRGWMFHFKHFDYMTLKSVLICSFPPSRTPSQWLSSAHWEPQSLASQGSCSCWWRREM